LPGRCHYQGCRRLFPANGATLEPQLIANIGQVSASVVGLLRVDKRGGARLAEAIVSLASTDTKDCLLARRGGKSRTCLPKAPRGCSQLRTRDPALAFGLWVAFGRGSAAMYRGHQLAAGAPQCVRSKSGQCASLPLEASVGNAIACYLPMADRTASAELSFSPCVRRIARCLPEALRHCRALPFKGLSASSRESTRLAACMRAASVQFRLQSQEVGDHLGHRSLIPHASMPRWTWLRYAGWPSTA